MFTEQHDGQHLECGWINPDVRTTAVKETHNNIMGAMPAFKIIGQFQAVQKVCLWDAARSVLGKDLPCYYQSIGSCVGQGKAKTESYTLLNTVLADMTQKYEELYEPYGYAQSRVCAGITGGSDGSTGSGAAEAATKFGALFLIYAPELAKTITYGDDGKTLNQPGSVEKSWGQHGAPAQYIPLGQKQLIKSTANLKNTDQVRDAIVNKYGVACASNWGGAMKPQVKNGVLLNRRQTTWNHQMSVSAYWDHPDLGEIFWIQNSWGWFVHGICPSGAPGGGFWISKSDMQFICDQGEVFAYSPFLEGFPADWVPWIF